MEGDKVIMGFRLVGKDEQLKYLAQVMASLNKAYKHAKTQQARDVIGSKINIYGSIYHSIAGSGKRIIRINKPALLNRLLAWIKGTKNQK